MTLENSAESQQARLAALFEVSSLLGSTLDLAEVLGLVMDATVKLTGAERGLLVLRDELTGELDIAAARQVAREDLDNDEQGQISRTVIRRTIETGRPILTNNAQEDERFSETQSVVSYQLRSIMCAPLQARGRTFGAAYVDNRLFSGVFADEDLELLAAFANQASMAIDNARLFAQTDQALHRRVEELGLFQRIDQELNKSLDLDRVLNLALEWAIRLTGADNGSIGLLEQDAEDEEGRFLRLLAHAGPAGAPGLAPVPADHPVLQEVLATQRSVRRHDVAPRDALDGSPAPVQLAVPIRAESAVIGVIVLESTSPAAFRRDDQVFVEQLADRGAVAIENARLYERIQAANEAKREFVSMVTHELRLPLTAIKGYSDLMLKGIGGTLNDQHREFMDVVMRNLNRMARLITDLSDINRIESGRMKFEFAPFDVREAITDMADGLRGAMDGRRQTLTLSLPPAPLLVHADRVRTAQVIGNLLTNAHKYTPDEGQISVTAAVIGDIAQIAVIDNGIGISEEDQRQLFQQFFRAEDAVVREQVGWGLGLSIVKMLVEAQNGVVSFQSRYRHGSRFEFTLPLVAATA